MQVHRLLRNLKVCDSEQDVDTLFTLMDVDNSGEYQSMPHVEGVNHSRCSHGERALHVGSGEVDLREFLSAFDNAVAQQELEVDGHALPTKLGDEGEQMHSQPRGPTIVLL